MNLRTVYLPCIYIYIYTLPCKWTVEVDREDMLKNREKQGHVEDLHT